MHQLKNNANILVVFEEAVVLQNCRCIEDARNIIFKVSLIKICKRHFTLFIYFESHMLVALQVHGLLNISLPTSPNFTEYIKSLLKRLHVCEV